jgi:hypothetical protein
MVIGIWVGSWQLAVASYQCVEKVASCQLSVASEHKPHVSLALLATGKSQLFSSGN